MKPAALTIDPVFLSFHEEHMNTLTWQISLQGYLQSKLGLGASKNYKKFQSQYFKGRIL